MKIYKALEATPGIELVGGCEIFRATTPEELAEAMAAARNVRNAPPLVEVIYEKGVISTALGELGRALIREKTGQCP